jgi:uncharacterized protein (TIGR03067 family)
MRTQLTVAVCVLMLLGADKADDKKPDLTGTWELTALESEGKADPDAATLKLKMTFLAGGKLTLEVGDKKLGGTFTADATANPKSADFTMDNDPPGSKPLKAIYVIDGDTLQICEALTPEKPRPAKFVSTKEGGETLLTFKRVKP